MPYLGKSFGISWGSPEPPLKSFTAAAAVLLSTVVHRFRSRRRRRRGRGRCGGRGSCRRSSCGLCLLYCPPEFLSALLVPTWARVFSFCLFFSGHGPRKEAVKLAVKVGKEIVGVGVCLHH